ncbi:C39 family peptidase [Trinickia dinghuensis]|uniref:C39 family peptidase n=1 Tax=Trinickia dinghuensis TaxID=2291023 RepID=UPI0015F19B62|nr:C39 family peptidase [Trinickia dinghuensis]
MNKRIAARLLSEFAIVAAPAFVTVSAQQIGIPQVTQQYSEWCWAADADAVLAYRGVSSTQCGIANWVESIGYACEDAPFDWNDAANSPNSIAGTTGISGILWSLGRRDSRYYDGALSFGTIGNNIDQGDPVVVLWTWRDGGGHFIVVDGYDDQEGALYFMNPWPGEGAGYGDYEWMLNGSGSMGTHAWAESLVVY